MKRFARSSVAVLVAGGLAVALAGCDPNASKSAGQQLDTAIAKTEHAAREAKATTQALAADAKAKFDEKAPDAQAALKDGASRASAATREAGAAIAGTVDDATITATVTAGLAKDPDLSATQIGVTTRQGVVTLKGPAPTQDAKARAEKIARDVRGVSNVENGLEVRAM